MEEIYQIAIDGLASSGKSSLAKRLAERLNIDYLNTGAMYRALTYQIIQKNIDDSNIDKICECLNNFDYLEKGGRSYLNDVDVTDFLHSEDINSRVSKVSQIPIVRLSMNEAQRKIGKRHSIVMDGRDIGTAVLPNAKYKFYVTADPHERAKRRYLQKINNGESVELEDILKSIIERDRLDTQLDTSPMRVLSEDAIHIDNTNMNLDECVEYLIDLISKNNSF